VDFDLPKGVIAVHEGVSTIGMRYGPGTGTVATPTNAGPRRSGKNSVTAAGLLWPFPGNTAERARACSNSRVAAEALAASGAGSTGAFLYLLAPAFGALAIARHGTPEQKRALLPGLAAGESGICFALAEGECGSNALEISTQALRRQVLMTSFLVADASTIWEDYNAPSFPKGSSG
jgi:acyl-CoA dehydrogenase